MWRTTYSLSYHMVSEWMPVFPLAKMLSAGGSQKPQVRHFARTSMWGSLFEPITLFSPALTQNWIQQTQKTSRKWRKRWREWHCTEWPRFTTFWRCGRAAKPCVLSRSNHALKTSRWLPWDTFRTWKRSSKHCGHSFNMMVRLYLNCQKDLLCQHLCLQRTSMEDELKYWMSAESEESTIIQLKLIRIVHLKAFRIPKIGLTGMGIHITKWKQRQLHGRLWIWFRARQYHRGSGMPWAAGC